MVVGIFQLLSPFGGSVYYFYKIKKNIKPPPPVEQIKIKSTIKSMD
jgi:hypothetical protein